MSLERSQRRIAQCSALHIVSKSSFLVVANNAAIADQIDFRPITALEPTIQLASIAAATTHIGLIG